MILKIKQIQSKIISTKKTRLNIYEGSVSDINEENLKFDNLISDDPNDLVKLLDDFNELYPNELFTGFLITKGQSTEKGAFIFQFRTDKEKADEAVITAEPKAVLNGSKSEDQIRSEIFKELEAKQKSETLIEEVRQLRIEIKEKDTLSGKFNGAIENIVLKFLQPPNPPINGALNGFNDQYSRAPGSTAVDPGPGTNTSDINELENAFSVLLKEFGEQNIIKLAGKLSGQNNDALKSMLINYINS